MVIPNSIKKWKKEHANVKEKLEKLGELMSSGQKPVQSQVSWEVTRGQSRVTVSADLQRFLYGCANGSNAQGFKELRNKNEAVKKWYDDCLKKRKVIRKVIKPSSKETDAHPPTSMRPTGHCIYKTHHSDSAHSRDQSRRIQIVAPSLQRIRRLHKSYTISTRFPIRRNSTICIRLVMMRTLFLRNSDRRKWMMG